MKKLFYVFVLVASMVAFTASATMASSVYLEGFVDGDSEILPDTYFGNNSYNGDANGLLAGFEYQQNAFKGSFEYLSGDWDINNENIDLTSYLIKGGYRVLENDITSIDIILAYYNQSLEADGEEVKFDGLMLGTDFGFNCSEKALFLVSAAFSLNGDCELDDYDFDADMIYLNIKFNYLVTDNFGASLGYRSYLNKISENDADLEFNTTSLTAGIFYKF